ncbi:hypothetical protein FHS92_000659 [Sphingobium subterraneum]|uniref:Uncharacterized protein n=1 Tax=Sphingobium subterraneum TaxID=627688 RepID=A0A841IXU1_9SPHN|nr:hypothetical protein [Sphingobium subterraneum]
MATDKHHQRGTAPDWTIIRTSALGIAMSDGE